MTHLLNNQKGERVVLSKGTRSPSGHHFEFFANDNGIYLIILNSIDKRSKLFKIDIKKYPVFENAVDVHIDYLGW